MTSYESILGELHELPSKAGLERVAEYLADPERKDGLLNDYRLTATPRDFAERFSRLPEDDFERMMDEVIERFPHPTLSTLSRDNVQRYLNSANGEVFCTVAFYALQQRGEATEAVKRKLLDGLVAVKGREMNVPVFDKLDEKGIEEHEITIDALIRAVAGLKVSPMSFNYF